MRNACIDHNGHRLRNLFGILLLFCAPHCSKRLWEKYSDKMVHDTWHRRRTEGGTIEDAYNDALSLQEGMLSLARKTLSNFLKMPLARVLVGRHRVNLYLAAKMDYNPETL